MVRSTRRLPTHCRLHRLADFFTHLDYARRNGRKAVDTGTVDYLIREANGLPSEVPLSNSAFRQLSLSSASQEQDIVGETSGSVALPLLVLLSQARMTVSPRPNGSTHFLRRGSTHARAP